MPRAPAMPTCSTASMSPRASRRAVCNAASTGPTPQQSVSAPWTRSSSRSVAATTSSMRRTLTERSGAPQGSRSAVGGAPLAAELWVLGNSGPEARADCPQRAGSPVLGPALRLIPIDVLRFVAGALLLAFGMQWLRKAFLRAGGYKPLHDEGEAFARERDRAEAAPAGAASGVDWYSFAVAFKGVLLEGLEVTFIVITFGSTQGRLGLAAAAAATAAVLVVIVGSVVRGPLEHVPENRLKFVVGVLLTSFGIFWGGEGAGVEWPGGDLAILWIAAGLALASLVLEGRLRRTGPLAVGAARA